MKKNKKRSRGIEYDMINGRYKKRKNGVYLFNLCDDIISSIFFDYLKDETIIQCIFTCKYLCKILNTAKLSNHFNHVLLTDVDLKNENFIRYLKLMVTPSKLIFYYDKFRTNILKNFFDSIGKYIKFHIVLPVSIISDSYINEPLQILLPNVAETDKCYVEMKNGKPIISGFFEMDIDGYHDISDAKFTNVIKKVQKLTLNDEAVRNNILSKMKCLKNLQLKSGLFEDVIPNDFFSGVTAKKISLYGYDMKDLDFINFSKIKFLHLSRCLDVRCEDLKNLHELYSLAISDISDFKFDELFKLKKIRKFHAMRVSFVKEKSFYDGKSSDIKDIVLQECCDFDFRLFKFMPEIENLSITKCNCPDDFYMSIYNVVNLKLDVLTFLGIPLFFFERLMNLKSCTLENSNLLDDDMVKNGLFEKYKKIKFTW